MGVEQSTKRRNRWCIHLRKVRDDRIREFATGICSLQNRQIRSLPANPPVLQAIRYDSHINYQQRNSNINFITVYFGLFTPSLLHVIHITN